MPLLSESAKKVVDAHFFGLVWVCLSHSLPGGKTRGVRKPPDFSSVLTHTARESRNKLKGLRPLNNPKDRKRSDNAAPFCALGLIQFRFRRAVPAPLR